MMSFKLSNIYNLIKKKYRLLANIIHLTEHSKTHFAMISFFVLKKYKNKLLYYFDYYTEKYRSKAHNFIVLILKLM